SARNWKCSERRPACAARSERSWAWGLAVASVTSCFQVGRGDSKSSWSVGGAWSAPQAWVAARATVAARPTRKGRGSMGTRPPCRRAGSDPSRSPNVAVDASVAKAKPRPEAGRKGLSIVDRAGFGGPHPDPPLPTQGEGDDSYRSTGFG